MVKKRQTDNQEPGSSTDSGGDEPQQAGGSGGSNAAGGTLLCQHIKKSVDTTRLRRQLKTSGLLYECSQCQKLQSSSSGGGGGVSEDQTLWLCLKCGTQLCGRPRNQHALQHFKTPHSDSHALAMNTRSFVIWCYDCNNEVSSQSRKNLLECVELVKRLAQKPPATTMPPSISNIESKFKSALEHLGPMVQQLQPAAAAIPLPPPAPPAHAQRTLDSSKMVLQDAAVELDRLPRVRGLTNLGNTCFFNAVMQCLAQTPFLLPVLRELDEPGEDFVLPGGSFSFKDKGDIELPMIKGTLSSWGGLTAALAHALEELQAGGSVFTPSKLFDKLCAKCPQFTGGDQHDAHELLRQLLESVRNEDLKRYQRVILQNLGYKDQDINSVSEEMRQKCKIYGNQAGDRILRPEQVFRGFLVSTLTCQDCFNISSRHEYFLDMSLPVAVEKPQPPQRRKTSPENSPSPLASQTQINTKFNSQEVTPFFLHAEREQPEMLGPSKSQVKKEKERERKAKRAAKHQRHKQVQKLSLKINGNAAAAAGDRTNEGANEPGHSSGGGDGVEETPREDTLSSSGTTSEHSDADVEDNLVEDTTKIKTKIYTDSNGNAQPLGEKRDDTPEHMDKDSLEEDENDSGIATSPAPNTAAVVVATTTSSSTSRTEAAAASLVSAGLSEKGASLIRQISIGSEPVAGAGQNGGTTAQVTSQLEQLKLREQAMPFGRAKRVRTQSYSDWSTTIAPRYQCEDGECSVQSCLNNFTAVELMTGLNKVGCESCTQRINGSDPSAKSVNTNATKQLLVSSPPAVLILHLKRFQLGPRCIFRKLTRAVSYPMMLDIAAFCGSKVKNLPNIDRKQKKLLYALYGVVEHSGGMYGGHYTAYVKVRPKLMPDDKRWKFLPHGSKAELDQDDDQLKKLEELMVKEKAREMRLNAIDDSDDFTNSSGSSNSSTSDEGSPPQHGEGEGGREEEHQQQQQQQQQQQDEAAHVQAPPGKWYYVSDSRVQEVSEETALKAQAYLLFYERIY